MIIYSFKHRINMIIVCYEDDEADEMMMMMMVIFPVVCDSFTLFTIIPWLAYSDIHSVIRQVQRFEKFLVSMT